MRVRAIQHSENIVDIFPSECMINEVDNPEPFPSVTTTDNKLPTMSGIYVGSCLFLCGAHVLKKRGHVREEKAET